MDWVHDGWFAIWHWIVAVWHSTPDSLGPVFVLGLGASFSALGGFAARRVEQVRAVRTQLLTSAIDDLEEQFVATIELANMPAIRRRGLIPAEQPGVLRVATAASRVDRLRVEALQDALRLARHPYEQADRKLQRARDNHIDLRSSRADRAEIEEAHILVEQAGAESREKSESGMEDQKVAIKAYESWLTDRLSAPWWSRRRWRRK